MDDSQCTILHVDMDCFFASVEILDNPTLAGKPVVVGGTGTRGVVASCTYEARVFGIRSAMATIEARRRCPRAIFIQGRYQRYVDISRRLHDVFATCSSAVEGIGLDEAFLDVAGVRRLLGTPLEVADLVRDRVQESLGLRCSVGVARTKHLAKLASKKAKPKVLGKQVTSGSGVYIVYPALEKAFLEPLPVGEIWGVGPATANRLEQLGIRTVGELAAVPVEAIQGALGLKHGELLSSLARGEDIRRVEPDRQVKTIGNEVTFPSDLHNHDDLKPVLVRLSDTVVGRLKDSGCCAKTVTIKIRYADLHIETKSHTFDQATDVGRTLCTGAMELLMSVNVKPGVRLLGVSVGGLAGNDTPRQLSFSEIGDKSSSKEEAPGDEDKRWRDIEAATRAVRDKFGREAVMPAVLTGTVGGRAANGDDNHWGPSVPTEPPGPSGSGSAER